MFELKWEKVETAILIHYIDSKCKSGVPKCKFRVSKCKSVVSKCKYGAPKCKTVVSKCKLTNYRGISWD